MPTERKKHEAFAVALQELFKRHVITGWPDRYSQAHFTYLGRQNAYNRALAGILADERYLPTDVGVPLEEIKAVYALIYG